MVHATFNVHFKTPIDDYERWENGVRKVVAETPEAAKKKALKELPEGSLVKKVKVARQ